MFAGFSRNVQRVVCMLWSVAVVAISVSVGAYGMHSVAAHQEGYSVTVVQLQ